MAHINFLTVTYTILAIIVGCIFLSGNLSSLFQTRYKYYFIWLYLLTIGELITLAIFIMYYQEISNKRGKRGEIGRMGKRGLTGNSANCEKCEQLLGNNI